MIKLLLGGVITGTLIGVGVGFYLALKLFEGVLDESDCDGLYR